MFDKMKEKARQKKIDKIEAEQCKYNKIKPATNVIFNIILAFLAFLAVVPFVFVIAISLTDEQALRTYGYSFIPKEFSVSSYSYIIKAGSDIIRSYGVTITITVVGTIIGVLLIGTYAYALSRKTYAYRKFFTIVITIPMMFGGGMVATYMIIARLLHLTNTLWALILPMAMNSFNIIVLRTFFNTSIPDAVVESAKIDGASEWRLFFQIVIPMSLPGFATIALFLTLGYWNDWFNALLYIEESSLKPLQSLLMSIESNMQFLKSEGLKLGLSVQDMQEESLRMAIVVISTLPILVAYPFFQRYFVNGLTVGAVKG